MMNPDQVSVYHVHIGIDNFRHAGVMSCNGNLKVVLRDSNRFAASS